MDSLSYDGYVAGSNAVMGWYIKKKYTATLVVSLFITLYLQKLYCLTRTYILITLFFL